MKPPPVSFKWFTLKALTKGLEATNNCVLSRRQTGIKRKAEEELEEDSDEDDLEKFHFYDCVFCKGIFKSRAEIVNHVRNCKKR